MSKKALILKLGAIGDVIMTVPAARELDAQGFEVHWVCGKAARPLLECYSWVKVIAVDDAKILKGTSLQRVVNIAALWKQIVQVNWDLIATLYFDRRYRLLTLPVRAKRRVMLSNQSRKTTLITVRSYSDEFARIMLDIEDGYRPQGLAPLRPDRLPPSPLQEKAKERRIAIVPGGTSNLIAEQTLRRWPIENYVTTAKELERRGWEIVLLGGPEDEWVRRHFEGIETKDFIGRATLPEVVSLLDTCDGVISHDTGPMHLAGISNACLVAILGPTNPGHVLPRRPLVVGLWGGQAYACRPCYDLRTYAPCQHAGCLREVTPEMVLDQLARLLEARSSGHSAPWQVISPIIETTSTVS